MFIPTFLHLILAMVNILQFFLVLSQYKHNIIIFSIPIQGIVI